MDQADVEKLGKGSLLWVDDLAYCIRYDDGKWRFLGPQGVGFEDWEIADLADVEVVLKVSTYDYLRKVPVGGVITFDKGDVAVHHRQDLWKVAGLETEYTLENLENYILDKNTIKELS